MSNLRLELFPRALFAVGILSRAFLKGVFVVGGLRFWNYFHHHSTKTFSSSSSPPSIGRSPPITYRWLVSASLFLLRIFVVLVASSPRVALHRFHFLLFPTMISFLFPIASELSVARCCSCSRRRLRAFARRLPKTSRPRGRAASKRGIRATRDVRVRVDVMTCLCTPKERRFKIPPFFPQKEGSDFSPHGRRSCCIRRRRRRRWRRDS